MSKVSNVTRWVRAPDLRRLLSSAFLYRTVQHALAPRSSRVAFVNEYVRPRPGDSVLDVGCGPADDLAYMPNTIRYVGFDASARYVEAARQRWGERGTFFQARVASSILEDEKFDIVVANGVIHHLDDSQVLDLLNLARSVLEPRGRLITKDPVLVERQRPVARFLVERDRGEYVRDTAAYLNLANQVFTDTMLTTRSDMLRCPYDHAIMVMRRLPSST